MTERHAPDVAWDGPAYRGGDWRGLVTEGALALLHPDVTPAVAAEIWHLVAEGKRMGAWIEYLASAGIATMPSFAMVESLGEGARVLVRGDVDVAVGGRVINGRDYTTWREEIVADPGVVDIRVGDRDAPWWPISAGVVAASQISARLGRVETTDLEDDDIELTVARMPGIAAALGTSSRPAREAEPITPAPQAQPEADDVDDEYDHLLWSTEQQEQHREADDGARPETGTPEEATATAAGGDLEATREPEPEPEGDVADSPWQPPTAAAQSDAEVSRRAAAAREEAAGGIIDSVPPWLRPAAAADHPATGPAESSLPAPSGPPIDLPAPVEPDEHATVLRRDLGAGAPEVAADPTPEPAPDPPQRYVLELSTGQQVAVDRPILIGRAPEAGRFGGDVAPRLIRVPNPQKDISATHVEVRPAGDHVVATDMNSTNGTVVHHPAQPSQRLQPGTGVPLAAGSTIDLGGVTIRLERA
ncbi:MAG TPA: FHA domain-containing protein [Actinomycetaceae bacterium]|nr:FHA domain-containing protein [Actinomycetaceae bacterium]